MYHQQSTRIKSKHLAISSLYFLFILILVTFAEAASSAGPRNVTVTWTQTTLLSGVTTACDDPSASSCNGGLAAAQQILRELRQEWSAHHENHSVVFFPTLDRNTAFVQMHPLSWGVNAKFFSHFNVSHYFVYPSLFLEDRDGLSELRNPQLLAGSGPLPLLSNIDISADDEWYNFVSRTHISDGVGFIRCDSDVQPNSLACANVVAVSTKYLRRVPEVEVVVVMFSSYVINNPPEGILASFVTEFERRGFTNESLPNSFVKFPEVLLYLGSDVPIQKHESTQTWVGGLAEGHRALNVFTLELEKLKSSSTPRAIANATASKISLSLDVRSPLFFQHVAWTVAEANLARANDPVIGYTTTMPFTRLTGEQFRMCMGGECSIAALFTDTMRWKFNTDIAFVPSGGVRGPGWEAGPVQVSDVWTALPFSNVACTGRIMGVRLWELLNTSYGLATFESNITTFGDRLLQVAGMRVRYAKHLPHYRLVSIDVLSRASGKYEPLERTGIYSWVADSFTCNSFAPFNEILNRVEFAGEVAMNFSDSNLQSFVREFLEATTSPSAPYDTTLQNRMVCVDCDVSVPNGVDASNAQWKPQSMNLVQTQASCGVDTMWTPSVGTCVSCPDGLHQPQVASTSCVVVEDAESASLSVPLGAYIAIPTFIVLLAAAIAWGVRNEIIKRNNLRDVGNAPREGKVAFVFTDIQNSTKLWGLCPRSMSFSLDLHHACIRRCIAKHHAYEVKTVGDSFMIAVASPNTAVQLALDLQEELYLCEYPKAINQVYQMPDGEDNEHQHLRNGGGSPISVCIDDDPDATDPVPELPVSAAADEAKKDSAAPPLTETNGVVPNGIASVPSMAELGDVVPPLKSSASQSQQQVHGNDNGAHAWNGLRVRIGVHIGEPEIVKDEVSKGYDYYGPDVNIAARVESIGAGGQICATRAVVDSLCEDELSAARLRITSLGTVRLAGVTDPVQIHQLIPTSLRERRFPKIEDDDGNNSESANDLSSDGNQQQVLCGSTRHEVFNSSGSSNASLDGTSLTVRRAIRKLTLTSRPKERRAILLSLAKPWRIAQSTIDCDEDRILNVLSKRISIILRREDHAARFLSVKDQHSTPSFEGSFHRENSNSGKEHSVTVLDIAEAITGNNSNEHNAPSAANNFDSYNESASFSPKAAEANRDQNPLLPNVAEAVVEDI